MTSNSEVGKAKQLKVPLISPEGVRTFNQAYLFCLCPLLNTSAVHVVQKTLNDCACGLNVFPFSQ